MMFSPDDQHGNDAAFLQKKDRVRKDQPQNTHFALFHTLSSTAVQLSFIYFTITHYFQTS